MSDPENVRPQEDPATQPTRAQQRTDPAAAADTEQRVERVPVERVPVERMPPPPPPELPWWDNPWPAVLTGILGLIVGGLIGWAIGGKGEATEAQRGAAPPVTQTVTNTKTVVHPQVVVHTVTAKTVTQTPSPASAESEQRARAAEASLRRVERENAELKRQLEEG